MQQVAGNNPPTMSSQPPSKHNLPPKDVHLPPLIAHFTPLHTCKLPHYYVTNYPSTPKTGEITPPSSSKLARGGNCVNLGGKLSLLGGGGG